MWDNGNTPFFCFLFRHGSAIILLVFHSRPVGLLGHLLWGVTPMPIFIAPTAGTRTPTGTICTRSANALTTLATLTP